MVVTKPDVCFGCPLFEAPMVRGEGKLEDGLGLVLMGEAPAAEEVRRQRPFVGQTGRYVLDPLLKALSLQRDGLYITNSLLCQLHKQDFKESQINEAVACCNERRKVERELEGAKFIVGMGGTAARALIGEKVVAPYRGAFMESEFGPCLITYHPTFVLRGKKDMRTRTASDVFLQVIYQDLVKGHRMVDPLVPDEDREFQPACVEAPDMADILDFLDWIRHEKTLMCVDVEADSVDPLSCNLTIIGFGALVDGVVTAYAVPLWEGNYTQAEMDEFYAEFGAVENDPDVPKLFHNFAYDVTVLERHGMPTQGKIEDTLIAHYCLYPELLHDLQFVACSYLNIGPWKTRFRRRQNARDKQYQALARWEDKLDEAAEAIEPYGKYAELVGKKLASAFAQAGLDEETLKTYKKYRTAYKRATKKLVELREGIDVLVDEEGRDELQYNASDVAATLGTFLQMKKEDAEDFEKIQKLYETDIAVGEIAREMQLRGLPVIGDAREKMQQTFTERLGTQFHDLVELAQKAVDETREAHPEWYVADALNATLASLEPRDRARVQLKKVLDEEFNPMSAAHKALLLDAYEVPVDEVTPKTGQRKMTKDTLVKYKGRYKPVAALLDYTATHKMLKTFVEGKRILIGEDGRIHPSWNAKGSTNPGEYGTVTGRWTSQPNVQNWPYEMRAMIGFRPEDEWTLVGADFSQLEFRILAWFAGESDLVVAFNEGPIVVLDPKEPRHAALLEARADEKKRLKACKGKDDDVAGFDLKAFQDIVPKRYKSLWNQRILRVERDAQGIEFIARDIHSNTAVTIFGDTYINAKLKRYKLLRDLTKRATYGGMYGGSAETLYNALHRDFPETSKEQCAHFLEQLDRLWPRIVSWRSESRERAARERVLRTPVLGRCRLFPLGRPEATVAYNFPIQATAADIMNTSLLRLYDYVQSRDDLRGKAFPIIQVHDAIYWEVRQEIADEFRSIVEEHMSCTLEYNTVRMSFPVEAKVGKKWSET